MQSNLPPFIFPHRQFPGHERVLAAGLPFFPAEFGGSGEKIKIVRCWQVEIVDNYAKQTPKRVFLRLQPPEYRIYEKYSPNISFTTIQLLYQYRPDLEIMWLGQIGSSIYLVLEQTPIDLDDEVFTQYIVRLNNSNSINIIGQTELQKLIPLLRTQIEHNPIISITDMISFLGVIHDISSPEYYFECIKERSVTRVLKVRWDIVSAGKSLPIRKWQHPLSENLSISVPIPSDPSINEDFFVKEYLNVDKEHYLILQAERTLISGEKWEAYLVKLVGNNIFSLNNDSEFQYIAQLFIDRLEKNSRGNNFRPLGSITAKEIELIIDYLSSSNNTNLLETTSNKNLSNLEKTQLTNLILVKISNNNISNQNITFKVAELGQPLTITNRWRISTRLYISLSFSDQVDNTEYNIPKVLDFSTLLVECIFSLNLWYYIVLLLPENLNNAASQPRFVLKIQDTTTLITLTEEELNKVVSFYQTSKNNAISTIGEILALLNSLSSNIQIKPFEKITSVSPITKQNNKITKSHLGSINNYYLEEILCKGSNTTIYLAKQTNLGNRLVVLKAIPDTVNELEASSFINQMLIISRLEHRSIVKLYQVGKSNGYYFASMQYIKGVTLSSLLKEKYFIAPMQLLFLIEQITEALAYVHEQKILHGDINPSKILITPNRQAFLLGFTKKNPIGNTTYFAPEQILNNSLSIQTDVYTLSLVVYEALTGHYPFESQNNDYKEILSKKLSAIIPPVQSFNPLLPKNLNTVFHKALSVTPSTRYQTVKEFLSSLKDCFNNLITEAKTISEFAIVDSISTNKYVLGLSADDYYLEHLLGEGIFSWVYYGVDSVNLSHRAFKIAKPPELAILPDHASNRTQEIEIMTGRVVTDSPNIYQLLQFQAEKMQKTKDPALVKVDKIVHTNNICYYQMEYASGQTLRELMDKERVPLRVIIEIAIALERLSQNPNFRYHGDLKPENIIINDTEIKLIDFGYFGCEEKSYSSTIITTPAYYPDLLPDDLFALGLIIWEIACHQQPFSLPGRSSEFVDLSNIGENLFEWVYHSELTGQYFKSAILHINRPSDICSDITPQLEDFLLKAINLSIRPDNKIDRKLYFKTFPQLTNALEDLIQAGITHL